MDAIVPAETAEAARASRRAAGAAFLALAALGAGLVVAFHRGAYLPARWGAAAIFVLTAAGLWRVRLARLSLLARLMILLYFMPFSVCWGYVFDAEYTWWYTPLSLEYMSDPEIVSGMLMVGLIGLVGLLAGLSLVAARPARATPPAPARTRDALSAGPFACLLAAAMFFSYINTPGQTIFQEVYTAQTGLAGRFNFNAAFLVAYTLLVLLYLDAQREARPRARRWKKIAVLAATLYVLVFWQLLRGDRDSFGLVVGLIALYFAGPVEGGPEPRRAAMNRRYTIVVAAGSAVLVAFLAIATFRTRVAEREQVPLGTAIAEGYKESTWGSVLLTNLSLAAQYHQGRMDVECGLTYLDYVYSLPPGFVTQALKIERPIEPHQGPNFWFSDISSGGVHAATVPFKNFLAPGVLVVLALAGVVIGWSERVGARPGWLGRLWYGSMFVGAAQWFWYGDMPFIREVMIFGIAAGMYALATSTRAAGRLTAEGS